MEVVNYEERYPTVVDESNTPTYKSQVPQANTEEKAPKYSAYYPADAKSQPGVHVYPEVAQNTGYGYANIVEPLKEEVNEQQSLSSTQGNPRFCGMSKKVFLIALVVLLVVVAAVVGAVGGVVAGKKSPEDKNASSNGDSSTVSTTPIGSVPTATQKSASSSSSVATSTATSIPVTLDTTKSIGSIAASTYEDDSATYIHLYYQQGSNIAYRTFPSSSGFTTPLALPMTVAAKSGTPLAATEYADSAGNHISLFYLDTYSNIICANYTSALTLSANLTLTNTITAAANTTVHVDSQLAAAYLGDGRRVYYQNTNKSLQELVGTGTTWKAGAALDASAVAGSSLALSMVSSPDMNIFYVDSKTETLFVINYSGGWKTPAALSNSSLTAWNGSSTALAAISETEPDYLRTYYVGTDSNLHEMLDVPGASWSNNSYNSPEWPLSDSSAAGAIAGIGFDDQVRLYWVNGGKAVQADLNNQTWTASTDLGSG